jgi:hypothetical protein
LAKTHNDDARKDLKAFIDAVQDKTPKSITPDPSNTLTTAAQAIIDALPTDKHHHDKDNHSDNHDSK